MNGSEIMNMNVNTQTTNCTFCGESVEMTVRRQRYKIKMEKEGKIIRFYCNEWCQTQQSNKIKRERRVDRTISVVS